MKVVVTGSSGMLGSNLVKTLVEKGKYEVYALDINDKIKIDGSNFIKIDLTDTNSVNEILSNIMPDIIIHCAALVDVDYCEMHKEKCYNIHVIATKNLVDFSKGKDIKFIYISTDAVYGSKEGNFKEGDSLNPINYYAETKILAEKIVQEIIDFIVLRVNIYGINFQEGKLSLVEWFIDKLKKKEQITGFKDVIFNPITVNNLSEIIIETIEKDIKGIINIGGSENINKYDFGKKVAKIFNLDASLIKSGTSDEINFIAKRPKNTTLDINKAKKMFDTKLLNIDEGLKEIKRLVETNWIQI